MNYRGFQEDANIYKVNLKVLWVFLIALHKGQALIAAWSSGTEIHPSINPGDHLHQDRKL